MSKPWRDVNVLYQIYPRSFYDTNSDGVGDLRGITEKLEYVRDTLGVDAVWISPFYPSPQMDCGYDVSDYEAVDPMFGTMKDFETLLAKAHEKGLKVVLDLVPNHTSDQHAWFKEARSSKDNPKRDWYVWRKTPPNNWISISGGSSWTLDETTGEYYLHSFMSSQPDLNWENPAVREAIKDVMKFWLNKGVDGFRVDAIWALSKDPAFADDPKNPEYEGSTEEYGSYTHSACKNGPRLAGYLRELASVLEHYDDKHLFFEYYADSRLGDVNEQMKVVHAVRPELSAPFYFESMHIPWHAEKFGQTLKSYLDIVPENSRPTICFSNHDQPRPVTRYGEEQARLIACMQMTLPGLPAMYYGDELGMENVDIPEKLTKDKFEETGDSGGRDPERTPMQWTDEVHGGFTPSTPWLPVSPSVLTKNVLRELEDPDSWLSLYRKLIALRSDRVLQAGSFDVIETDSGYVLTYKRELGDKRYYVVLNFAAAAQVVTMPEKISKIVVASRQTAAMIREDGRIGLDGYGAALLAVPSDQDTH